MKPTPNSSGLVASANPTHSVAARFDFAEFVAREQRRTLRLIRAAYGVGGTHAWFRAAPRALQVETVREWVEVALHNAAMRRGEVQDDEPCRGNHPPPVIVWPFP